MPLDYLTDFIYSNLQLPIQSGFKWTARCPICGDSAKDPYKRRFGIIYDPVKQDGKAHCFNCGYSAGSLVKVFMDVKHLTFQEIRKELQGNSLEVLKNSFQKEAPKIKVVNQPVFEDFSWILQDCILGEPDGIVQKKLFSKFLEFKESRKLECEMYCCYTGEFRTRAILPIYQDKKMVYFQARTLTNSDKKYKNPTSPKRDIVFNRDNWDSNFPVVVTEGLLDALSVGKQGTMCLGASISDAFLEKLPDQVIVSLDNDETGRKSMLEMAKKSKFRSNLQFCVYPKNVKCKDLNEVLVSGLNVYDFVQENSVNSFTAQLLLA